MKNLDKFEEDKLYFYQWNKKHKALVQFHLADKQISILYIHEGAANPVPNPRIKVSWESYGFKDYHSTTYDIVREATLEEIELFRKETSNVTLKTNSAEFQLFN